MGLLTHITSHNTFLEVAHIVTFGKSSNMTVSLLALCSPGKSYHLYMHVPD